MLQVASEDQRGAGPLPFSCPTPYKGRRVRIGRFAEPQMLGPSPQAAPGTLSSTRARRFQLFQLVLLCVSTT